MPLSLKIKKNFGGFQLDMELEAQDERLALLGASGCGKSMTLRCIAGIVTPDEGHIILNGRTLFDSQRGINLPPQQRRVGLLFQNYALFPNMTVVQNIASGIREKLPRAEKQRLCREIMEKFYLTGLEKHRPSQLSGGQQQRVALARILISRPEILLLDEPFSALDSYLRWELEQELMRVLKEFSGPSLLVSHNRDEVYRICTRIAVVKDGHVDALDDREALFAHPPTYQAALLTGCKNFSKVRRLDEGHVEALDWGCVFTCGRPVSDDIRYLGVRPHFVHPAAGEQENNLTCQISQVIDNLVDIIVHCTPLGADPQLPPLHLRFKREEWKPYAEQEQITLHFEPKAILLLRA
jgi:molybdate transport system ATP-binding protein